MSMFKEMIGQAAQASPSIQGSLFKYHFNNKLLGKFLPLPALTSLAEKENIAMWPSFFQLSYLQFQIFIKVKVVPVALHLSHHSWGLFYEPGLWSFSAQPENGRGVLPLKPSYRTALYDSAPREGRHSETTLTRILLWTLRFPHYRNGSTLNTFTFLWFLGITLGSVPWEKKPGNLLLHLALKDDSQPRKHRDSAWQILCERKVDSRKEVDAL